MYNEERKQAYLESANISQSAMGSLKTLFKFSEPVEQEAGQDIAELGIDDLQKAFSLSRIGRPKSFELRRSVLILYIKWCEQQGYPTSDAVGSLTSSRDSIPRVASIKSPQHLADLLDQYFDPLEEQTVHILYRTWYWLIYMGIPQKEIIHIKAQDIDIQMKQIYFEMRYYKIPQEAIQTISAAIEATGFLEKREAYTAMKPRKLSPYLFRSIKTECTTYPSLVRSIFIFTGKNNILSAIGVRLSGYFYKLYQRELIGIEPDFMELAYEDAAKNKREKLTADWAKQKALQMRKLYVLWKEFVEEDERP